MQTLARFIQESNAIESIHRDPNPRELAAATRFLNLSWISTQELSELVQAFQPDARLRAKPGMDVRIRGSVPTSGGPAVTLNLSRFLVKVNFRSIHPLNAHVAYEVLHPFTDGNGRSGRMLWLWLMRGEASLGFLHTFYYQTLAAADKETMT